MSTKTKARAPRMTSKEKKLAQQEANRKAMLQWYAVGAVVVVAVVTALVLITIFTEGELPYYTHG